MIYAPAREILPVFFICVGLAAFQAALAAFGIIFLHTSCFA